MFPNPITHDFVIDGDAYSLRETDEPGEDRIKLLYARAIAEVPGVLDMLYGMDLYAKAVLQVCLVKAPASLWVEQAPTELTNGTAHRTVTFVGMRHMHWLALRKEVDAFLARLPHNLPTLDEGSTPVVPADTPALETAETLPPVFRGQAR